MIKTFLRERMDISSQILSLLNDEVTLEEQCKIIQRISARIYEQGTLFEIAETFLGYAKKIENSFVDTMDIVGTGGDGCKTLNYSTLSALLVHAMGAKVAKHGNKSMSSKCGSFDFLQQINIEIPKSTQAAFEQLKDSGITFLFAPFFHPIFAKVVEARKHFAKQGEKTFFNVLGPLLNPVQVKRIVAGVYDQNLLKPYADCLMQMGVTHAYIVYGDGLDEFSVCGVNQVIQIHEGKLKELTLHPEQLGFVRSQVEYLAAGDAHQNLQESQAILNNELLGVKQDTLILNSAAALHVAKGFDRELAFYIEAVKSSIQAGEFANLLPAKF